MILTQKDTVKLLKQLFWIRMDL